MIPTVLFVAIGAVVVWRIMIRGMRHYKVDHPHIGVRLGRAFYATVVITIGACIIIYLIGAIIVVILVR